MKEETVPAPTAASSSSSAKSSASPMKKTATAQTQQAKEVLKCDYLVIGAGTAGMSFIDTLLSEHKTKNTTLQIILVDRFSQPGGHWTHAYPFVELHQTSCNYGINSMPLGTHMNKKGKGPYEKYDIHDRATGKDVLQYYQKCLQKFQKTGRVKCYFNSEYTGIDTTTQRHTIVVNNNNNNDKESNNKDEGGVRMEIQCTRIVKVANDVVVPDMRGPLIPVDESIRDHFVPVNDVTDRARSGHYQKYIVFGNGKTGADAVINLIQNCGVDPAQITWICSRHVWYFIRDTMADFWQTFEILNKMTDSKMDSITKCFLTFEQYKLAGRIDTTTLPEIFKGPTIDQHEFDLLCTVHNIVRHGRATGIEADRIVFNEGATLEFTPLSKDGTCTTLFVDCMVDKFYGYNFPKGFQIFEEENSTIHLGPILSAFNVSLSAAHTAFLECNLPDARSKNQCCYFLRGDYSVQTPESFVGMMYLETKTQEALLKLKGGSKFFFNSRTNLNAPQHHGKYGLLKLLWKFYGPKQYYKFPIQLQHKIETHGYTDLNHCFGIETFDAPTKVNKNIKTK